MYKQLYVWFGHKCCYVTKYLHVREWLANIGKSTSGTTSWYLPECPSGGN